ncbi:MAG: hypothetical protein WCJ52_11240 [Phenylobacterium sp.]|uniref:hypothetical protein n=1 Tax=Phenylobacterium sp. TaxID=1871053 RepID=UPI00301753A7
MGKKKTKTTATETSRTVTTPTRPDWVDAQARGLNAALTDLGRGDPAASVAPLSDLERRASDGASGFGLGEGWNTGTTDWASWGRPSAGPGPVPGPVPWAGPGLASGPAVPVSRRPYALGADLLGPGPADRAPPAFPTSGPVLEGTGEAPQAASVLDRLSSYMTPFRDQVLAAAMDDYDAEAGRRRATQDLELAGQGAFGGSGAALTRSLTEGELARGRNSRLAGLLDQMFTQGAGLASGDADRRQQASTAAAQLAQARDLQRAQLVQARDLEQARLGQEWGLETSRLGQARDFERARLAQEGGLETARLDQSRDLETARLSQARDLEMAQLSQSRDLETARLSQAGEASRMQDALARAQLGQEGELTRSRLGLDAAASRRADAETQARIGAQVRAAEQARLSAPEQALARRIEMFSGLPLGLFQGSATDSQGQRSGTETTSGATLGEIAQLVNSLTGSPLSRLFQPKGGA